MRYFLTTKIPFSYFPKNLLHTHSTNTLTFHDMPCCITQLSVTSRMHLYHLLNAHLYTNPEGKGSRKHSEHRQTYIEWLDMLSPRLTLVGNQRWCWISSYPYLFISRKQQHRFTQGPPSVSETPQLQSLNAQCTMWAGKTQFPILSWKLPFPMRALGDRAVVEQESCTTKQFSSDDKALTG